MVAVSFGTAVSTELLLLVCSFGYVPTVALATRFTTILSHPLRTVVGSKESIPFGTAVGVLRPLFCDIRGLEVTFAYRSFGVLRLVST